MMEKMATLGPMPRGKGEHGGDAEGLVASEGAPAKLDVLKEHSHDANPKG